MHIVNMNDYLRKCSHDLITRFPDAESARVYFERLRWNSQIVCPHCSSDKQITARKGKRAGYYCCGACKEEFSVRTNTIFERSHVPLHKWIYAIYLTISLHNGISTTQLSRQISVTQKTAWNMKARILESFGDPLEHNDRERFDAVGTVNVETNR